MEGDALRSCLEVHPPLLERMIHLDRIRLLLKVMPIVRALEKHLQHSEDGMKLLMRLETELKTC